jgi:predicted P-loop ATPase
MSSYALINIDEFDAMSKSQQPILKYLLSKHDVKFRPPYGKTIEERRRFASFIATTNNLRPLTDPTGSRRFVCVYAEEIDNDGIIHYDKLYSQLYAELQQGRRYWFEDEDNARIIEQNQDFQKVYDYARMVELTYLPPEETPAGAKFILLKNIMKRFEEAFPTFVVKKNTDRELGHKLSDLGYEYKKQNKGASYRMKEK